jgi:hypothetical protein
MMNLKKVFLFLLSFALLIMLASAAQTQVKTPKAKFVDRITVVLEKAGLPLSQSQLDAIAKIASGPDARGAMQKILSDDQKKTLQTALKKQRTGLFLKGMAQKLKAAGVPLTNDQIAKIKAFKPGEGKGALQTILTDDQKKALKKLFVDRLTARLKDAGQPLSVEQLKAIDGITPGQNVRAQVKAILTPEQVSALKKGIGDASAISGTTDKTTAVSETLRVFNTLKPNFPNPFNPSTTIEYSTAQPGNVRVQIFGINGQLISTLVDSYQTAGWHNATWNAGNLAGGMYLCTVTSGVFTQSMKMTLLK